MTRAFEANFDGLVGPTHHYGGLSYGNVASTSHRALVSNPREAALQGLEKMKALADLGLKQGVLPPQQRPDLSVLRKLGFAGTDAQVIERTWKTSPEILSACYSASSMWTANAATVSPSADTEDGKVHFTPANLTSKFHRSIEPEQTGRTLKAIFSDEKFFVHHPSLPPGSFWGDEGAANHTRFGESYGGPGLEFFVFGRYAFQPGHSEPKRFPARQTFEASQAIARLHRISEGAGCFAQQNPDSIDAGVFHNDVASVGNLNFFFCHEQAFLEQAKTLESLKAFYRKRCGGDLEVIQVSAAEVSIGDAVKSYLFNSQILSLSESKMVLVAPMECAEVPSVKSFLDRTVQPGATLSEVKFFDLRQSMRNGGGPACLRLRVILNEKELKATSPGVWMSESLYSQLRAWVERHYRDRLSVDDLRDPKLIDEVLRALDELTGILGIGSIYPFQLP